MYHFKIVVEGDTTNKDEVYRLYNNLKSEMWEENWNVEDPEINDISTKTRCYRCGKYCEWDGPEKTYPRLLDFKGNPACPSDAPMPKEFREDGP